MYMILSRSQEMSDVKSVFDDEYSNSSRLHLAGGNDFPSYRSVSPPLPHYADTSGSEGRG